MTEGGSGQLGWGVGGGGGGGTCNPRSITPHPPPAHVSTNGSARLISDRPAAEANKSRVQAKHAGANPSQRT